MLIPVCLFIGSLGRAVSHSGVLVAFSLEVEGYGFFDSLIVDDSGAGAHFRSLKDGHPSLPIDIQMTESRAVLLWVDELNSV